MIKVMFIFKFMKWRWKLWFSPLPSSSDPLIVNAFFVLFFQVILNLLNNVGKLYPQAVYLPVRTLYLTLRIEQRGRYKRGRCEWLQIYSSYSYIVPFY